MAQAAQTISEMIAWITRRKVVNLEDVAAEFHMTTTDVIQRIEQLESEGRLTGITDDRGKYIHITEQEFESVTQYILTKGRVNRQELLGECNKLIRMEPTASDQKLIKLEV